MAFAYESMNMKTATSDVLLVLTGLIKICRDGQEGFRDAAENIQDPGLKTQLGAFSLQRAKFAGELQTAAYELGDHDPEDAGSIAGGLHRNWAQLKGAINGNDPHAILSECERGEDEAVCTYEHALEDYDLPRNIREIIEQQFGEIKNAHDTVKQLRDASKK